MCGFLVTSEVLFILPNPCQVHRCRWPVWRIGVLLRCQVCPRAWRWSSFGSSGHKKNNFATHTFAPSSTSEKVIKKVNGTYWKVCILVFNFIGCMFLSHVQRSKIHQYSIFACWIGPFFQPQRYVISWNSLECNFSATLICSENLCTENIEIMRCSGFVQQEEIPFHSAIHSKPYFSKKITVDL